MKKHFKTRLICAFLLFSAVFCAVFVPAFAESDDYSYPYATLKEEIYADEFLAELFPDIDFSDAEKNYLRLQSGFLFAYNTHIPTSEITTEYQDSTLTVKAEEYTYTASNGTTVKWTPVSAEVNGQTKYFADAPYTVKFFGVHSADGKDVRVEYQAKFTVSAESIDRLLNLAYTDAPRLEAEIAEREAEYEKKHAEYLINTKEYNEYLAELAVYNEYLAEKRLYDEKNAKYLAYLEELADYNIAMQDYREYIKARDKYYRELAEYTKYLAYAEQNAAKIEAYEKYQEKMDTVLAQLDPIKKTKTPLTDLKRTVYAAIMGDTVTSVIQHKGDIVTVLKADPVVVDLAGKATENLRVLLKEFFDIKNTEQQYKYYITNYEAFRDNFIDLLKALDELYLNEGVRGVMIAEGKHEKYLILVAQLYYVANALSDTPIKTYRGECTFDENYKIGRTYSQDKRSAPADVINSEPFITDTDKATPLKDGFPIAPEKPEYTKMEEPVMPIPKTEPIAPNIVAKPKAPAPVAEPVAVSHPGKEPKPYEVPSEVSEIISAYNSSALSLRAGYSGEDIDISPKITVNKRFFDIETVTVTYYDREWNASSGASILYQTVIDKGSYADYLGALPEKDEGAEHIYIHSGWTDANGNSVDFTSIQKSVDLYPSFTSVEKDYETVWSVNGEIYYDNPVIPPLPSAEEFYYDFSNWDKKIDPVTSDVTYVAVYDTPLVPDANGAAKITYKNGIYTVEPVGVLNKIDIGLLVQRVAGNGEIEIRLERGERIKISYSETIALSRLGASTLTLTAVARGEDQYAYVVELKDSDGNTIQPDGATLTLTAPCSETEDPHFMLYYEDDGEKQPIRSVREGGSITFSMYIGRMYYAKMLYSVTPLVLDNVRITVDKTLATVGENVYLSLDTDGGIRVDRIYIIGSDGVKTTVDGESFKMPAGDMTVGVEYTVLTYTVTFVSDGKTIVTYICNYGDTVVPPDDPKKAANDKFSYTFERWSPAVSEVTGDVTYTAVYKAVPIAPSGDDNMELTPLVLKLLLLAGVGLGSFVLIVIPSLIMTGVLISRRKKSVGKLQNHKNNK